jgi:hypothetical protein
MSAQEIFIQQFARLFRHRREALSPAAEQKSASWNSDRNQLVAAARSVILDLETRALLHDDGRRLLRQACRSRMGVLNQLLLTAQYWLG